jgi:hypothetical protein
MINKLKIYHVTYIQQMAQYYILSKQSDVDTLYENLSSMLPPDTVTVSMVNDKSEIMPAKYIRIRTALLSDAGLIDMVKTVTDVFCKDRKIKIIKDLEGRIPLASSDISV